MCSCRQIRYPTVVCKIRRHVGITDDYNEQTERVPFTSYFKQIGQLACVCLRMPSKKEITRRQFKITVSTKQWRTDTNREK